MDSAEYINKYGGKAGGLFYLRDFGGFEAHLMPFYYLSPEIDVGEIEGVLPRHIQDNWILRGTHPNDHEGFVDILDSDKLIGFDETRQTVLEKFKTYIEVLRDNAKRPEIFDYSKYEGQDYDGEIGIVIQPLNPGRRGSVVEHPNERGTYLIDIVTKNIGCDVDSLDRLTVIGDKIDEQHSNVIVRIGHEELAEKIVTLYDRVRGTEYIPPESSFQMEFGINEGGFDKERVLFYQARPFLKFEEPPFKLGDDWWGKYSCFGITPEEGVTLPVVKTFHQHDVNEIPHDFAWVIQNMTARMSAHARPRNMRAFLPIGLRVNSLEHNTYRWIRKADVSILDPHEEFSLNKLQTGDDVKIVSNGLYHTIEKSERE